MRLATLLRLVIVLAAVSSCSVSSADREAAHDAWVARDAERTAECRRDGGQFTAGSGCLFRGP